jgi:hypothetical protein
MSVLRRRQLQVIYHLSHHVDIAARILAVLFAATFLTEALIHQFVGAYPGLAVFDAFNPESLLHVVTICCDLCIVVLLFVYYLGLRAYLIHPNKRWALILAPQDFKERILHGPTREELANCKVEFVSIERRNVDALIGLNETAFAGSNWALGPDQLRARNLGFIDRNKYVFMLMKSPIIKQSYIGYSCILPLTPEGADAYQHAAHGDVEMPAWYVARTTEKPAALLIFAIALDDKYSLRKSGADREFSEYFINCIWCHLLMLCTPWTSIGYHPPLWAQTDEPGLARKLRTAGFVGTDLFTRDNLEILELRGPLGIRENP